MTERRLPSLRSLTGRSRRTSDGLPPPEPAAESVPDPAADRYGSVVDSAVYVDGDRIASPTSLAETYASLHAQLGSMAWIGLYRPDERLVGSVASEFALHELAIEDAILAHQRPKLERYDDTLFVVLHAARYLGASGFSVGFRAVSTRSAA